MADYQSLDPAVAAKTLAGAKLVGALQALDAEVVKVEANSVYGAAILMPQLARTAGWPMDLTLEAIKSYIYLYMCILIHGMILMYISKEELVMDSFGGQMFLCDFGADMDTCTKGTTCIGPGGTDITPPRLYAWSQWATRNFVTTALKAAFPDKADKFDVVADPGEYGLESYGCRLLCVFVLILSMISELDLIFQMAKLLWYVPTRNEPWIDIIDSDNSRGRDRWLEEELRVHTHGMNRFWKVFYSITVLIPKFCLWQLTATAGVTFLMETGGVDDVIVNSVALGFLLTMDETITDSLMSVQANKLLDICQGYTVGDDSQFEPQTPEDTIEKYANQQRISSSWLKCIMGLFPTKLIFVCLITFFYVMRYYGTHCTTVEGRYVSKTMYLPKDMQFTFMNAFAPHFFPVPRDSEPYWTYPTPQD